MLAEALVEGFDLEDMLRLEDGADIVHFINETLQQMGYPAVCTLQLFKEEKGPVKEEGLEDEALGFIFLHTACLSTLPKHVERLF